MITMAKTKLKIEGMMCEGCVSNVKKALESVPETIKVDIDLKKGLAVIEHDGASDDALIRAVVDAGFRASVKRGLF